MYDMYLFGPTEIIENFMLKDESYILFWYLIASFKL